jgi:hypothetical protein
MRRSPKTPLSSSLLLFLILTSAGAQPMARKGDAVLGERIAKGLVFGGRLWLISGRVFSEPAGGLISLGLADSSRQVHFNRDVVDIAKSADQLWVLRSSAPKGRQVVLSVWKNGAFEDLASFEAAEKDDPVALLDNAGTPMILSQKAIRRFSPDEHKFNTSPLKGELSSGVQVSAAIPAGGDSIYVGFNIGEFGGGLQRIDLPTGAISYVDPRDSTRLCEGLLNRHCAPVTGVIPDSEHNECVLASVGLLHISLRVGRIMRVCGENVTLLVEKPLANDANNSRTSKNTERINSTMLKATEPLYGLASAADASFWAIGCQALYRFNADGTQEKRYSLPKLKSVSGVHISREVPGAIVVLTDVNWTVSVSGYTPLLIPMPVSQP